MYYSCSLAHLSHFLTLTSILSKETRKRETRNMSQGCSPLLASVLLRKGCTGGQLHVAASQGPAQLLPGAPCSGQHSPLASSAPHPLSAGALGNASLKIVPPRSLLILVAVVLLFSKHYMEKCLSFLSLHMHIAAPAAEICLPSQSC